MADPLTEVDLTDTDLISHPAFTRLTDTELAVLVTKELDYLISRWELRGKSSGKLTLGISTLKERVRAVDSLAVNTKCDMWSILHMAHPLIYKYHVTEFRENEREVFLALSQDVIITIKTNLNGGQGAEQTTLSKLEHKLTFPIVRRPPSSAGSDKARIRSEGAVLSALNDLELVIVCSKEINYQLTEQYLKPKHKDLPNLKDKIRVARKLDADIKHKLKWFCNQQDLFLENRFVNNFIDLRAREVFMAVYHDLTAYFESNNPEHSLSNNSSIEEQRTADQNKATDKRFLVSGIVIGKYHVKHLRTKFGMVCLVMFMIVVGVLVYELVKNKKPKP